METEEEVGRENMPGGKAVAVQLMKRLRAPSREAEDQTGASGPLSETPGRWRALAGPLVGQWSMACSKISGAFSHLGQVVGGSSLQEGCGGGSSYQTSSSAGGPR